MSKVRRSLHLGCLLVFFMCLFGTFEGYSYNDYSSNPYVTQKQKKQVTPHLLPADSPLRKSLDNIFYATRATTNKETLIEAGFEILFIQPRSYIYVVRHPSLPGYLLKVYLDNEKRQKKEMPGWHWFVKRCEGAKLVKKAIKKHKAKHFTVADEWIYPLPLKPSPPNTADYERKNEILIVKDMNLTSKEESLNAWKQMTKKHLKELYSLIVTVGGRSYREDNIPYTHQGVFAFIDTEYAGTTPSFSGIAPFLSTEMQQYWEKLIKQNPGRLHKNRKMYTERVSKLRSV